MMQLSIATLGTYGLAAIQASSIPWQRCPAGFR
jgi:hypothetical protein